MRNGSLAKYSLWFILQRWIDISIVNTHTYTKYININALTCCNNILLYYNGSTHHWWNIPLLRISMTIQGTSLYLDSLFLAWFIFEFKGIGFIGFYAFVPFIIGSSNENNNIVSMFKWFIFGLRRTQTYQYENTTIFFSILLYIHTYARTF